MESQASTTTTAAAIQQQEFSENEFLNVNELDQPKAIHSLISLWTAMFAKQASEHLSQLHKKLIDLAKQSKEAELDGIVSETSNIDLFLIARELHIKIHLEEIDKEVTSVELPQAQIRKAKGADPLDSQLILQSFLDYLKLHGTEDFSKFVNSSVIRLVSTVHPNETERNTNLMHYTSLQEKYIEWKKDFESLSNLKQNAPEYRIRRETLNQVRRAIKAEIEGLWQSDQMRKDAINVQNEAKRITERYKVIFKAYPTFMKFVKKLAYEAFWRYQASKYFVQSTEWKNAFLKNYKREGNIRDTKLKAIKKTFAELGLQMQPPRITNPVIEFGTWKGGDRDGNPFVVASFTNQTFIEQKEFVLQQYVDMAGQLVDKLTPSTSNISVTDALKASLVKDQQLFPYLTQIKPQEPYRAKMRYILEKLENTLSRVKEVKKQSGETTKPLLGLSLPGPTGYNTSVELQKDINVLYESLLKCGGKAQARSLLQDFNILTTTFKLHMTAIDFRQTSDKNQLAAKEFLVAVGHPLANTLAKMDEASKLKSLGELLLSDDIELTPWTINSLSKISRDTFETFQIFSDASRADPNAVGKFIISMCQNASDILIVLFLMKINGMLETANGEITKCPFDVTGLFETIEDLINAPRIVKELLSIPLIRKYVVNHRASKLTIMLGYSDSVRDGSSFTSDAQIANTTIVLNQVEAELNQNAAPAEKISLVLYRGRGDTLPRGYGGSIEKALMSQILTTKQEDHTEQNRYLRRYATFSSALDHLHRFYSAHLSSQLKPRAERLNIYLSYFEFFGKISQHKWTHLVREDKEGLGLLYFGILNKYSVLPHLPKSNFASRPVARDGITYNVETIRAIPFTMALAQLRDFTNAYYGTGTAFQAGTQILGDSQGTALALLKEFVQSSQDIEAARKRLTSSQSSLGSLLNLHFASELSDASRFASLVEKANQSQSTYLPIVVKAFGSQGAEIVATLLLDLHTRGLTPLGLLQEMYKVFTPFRYSIQNKEQALIIRNKKIVDDYCRDATSEEKTILSNTEEEGQLSSLWILKITGQEVLEAKTLTQDFNSADLSLLHRIQSKFMRDYRKLQAVSKQETDPKQVKLYQVQLQTLGTYIQMSILAISEALGFGG